MKITFTIADENDVKFKKAFLRVHPIPVNPDTGLEEMTGGEWIREKLRSIALQIYNEGVRKLEVDKINVVKDDAIIT